MTSLNKQIERQEQNVMENECMMTKSRDILAYVSKYWNENCLQVRIYDNTE